jgi:hypothetical protein
MNARSFDRVALVSLPQSLARIPSCERSKARCILDLGCSRDNPIQRDVVFESKLTRQQLISISFGHYSMSNPAPTFPFCYVNE